MSWGLPKLPGLTFSDPTKTAHHIRSSLHYRQGYMVPDTDRLRRPGGTPTDVDSNAFAGAAEDSTIYDPSLTYGRVKQPALPLVIPHWVHYDQRCLNFTAFMKQPVYDDPDETYRLRVVNLIYFLEDDTLTVIEPRVRNSGLWQGRMVKRGRIPKNDLGEFIHWKDLDVGKDIPIFGKVFHTVSCDLYTKEWLQSQGIELSKEEALPTDAHAQKERWKSAPIPTKVAHKVDTLRRFLEYDGKILNITNKFHSINPEKVDADFNHRFTEEEVLDKFAVLRSNPFSDRLVRVFSSRRDARLGLEDLLDLCSAMSPHCPAAVKAAWAFRVFDIDEDHQISRADIRDVLCRVTGHRQQRRPPAAAPGPDPPALDPPTQDNIASLILDEACLVNREAITLQEFKIMVSKMPEFDCVWDNRDEGGCLEEFKLLYFLQDDTIAIKEVHDDKGGKDPFPLLLKKTKLPKKWKERPVDFPGAFLEVSDSEVTEYYSPCDLSVGETVFVLGRRFLLYDCDAFTRQYYKSMLGVEQPPAVPVPKPAPKEYKKTFPPHIGIGTPEDSLGSCRGLVPKPPHKDVIKYNLNANKYLRYLCELEWVHPEDAGRQFVLSYSLADGSVKVDEIARRNSGRREGRFLCSMKLQTPDSDPNFPTYVTPVMFYIGAIVPVFKHRFKITGCDLFVYRYMTSNPEKFPPEVIDNVRNYHLREGNLKDDLKEAVQEEQAAEMQAQLAKIGAAAVLEPSAMQQCLAELAVDEAGDDAATTPRAPDRPPADSDTLSYEDSLRIVRQSRPPCLDVPPLKGILKSGAARDDHQKVVCFSGPEPPHRAPPPPPPPGQQPHYDDSPDFCQQFKEDDAAERAERRARHECPYEVSPSRAAAAAAGPRAEPEPALPGHLGAHGVDCKETPDYMRLPPDAYERVKSMRREEAEVSPAVGRGAGLARLPPPPPGACRAAERAEPCAPPPPEDVTFACAREQRREPFCQPDEH